MRVFTVDGCIRKLELLPAVLNGVPTYHGYKLRQCFPSCEWVVFFFHIHFFLSKTNKQTTINKETCFQLNPKKDHS